jgi:hypothetical protein
MNEILFVEHDALYETTDKPHCSDCESLGVAPTDKPHCADCEG